MTTGVGGGRIAAPRLDDRLDLLSCQIEEIAADLRRQQESRAQWEELAQTLVPVSRGAFDVASRELEDLSEDVSVEDAVRLLRTIARSLPQLERMLSALRAGPSTTTEPPSTLGLVKQLRDPQTRLGLARALALVRALGDQPVAATDPHET